MKRLWKTWVSLALLAVILASVAVWLASVRAPTQILMLPNGMKYRFVGATWGTNHWDMTDTRLMARVVYNLPKRLGVAVYNRYGARLHLLPPIPSTQPSLCLWLKVLSTNTTPAVTAGNNLQIDVILANGDGAEAGDLMTTTSSAGSAAPVVAFFTMVPRRSRHIEAHFYRSAPGIYGTGLGPGVARPEIARVRFANPAFGHYPQWNPEPLPATKSIEDAQITLTRVVYGLLVGRRLNPETRKLYEVYRAAEKGENARIYFDWDLNPTQGTNNVWTVQETEISDATGNTLRQDLSARQYGTFWPDEAAVRFTVALKRSAEIPGSDLITFTNLPLPMANVASGTELSNSLHGVGIVARNFPAPRRFSGSYFALGNFRTSPFCVEIELADMPDAGNNPPGQKMAIDLVDITTDTGEKLTPNARDDSGNLRVRGLASIPEDAHSLNVTVAVQKLRTLDFYLKPEIPK